LKALFLSVLEEPERFRELVEAHPLSAPLLYIAFQALQVVLAPIPGEATGFIGGYLFGAWWGLLYSMIGLTIGSSIAFYLARFFRRFFAARFEKWEKFQKLKRFMEGRGLLAAFICYLFPGFPKDYLSYFLGLFDLPYPVFLVIMFFGRLPGTMALALEGASLYERDWTLLVIVTVLSLLFFGLFYLYRDRLYRYLEGRHAHRLS